MNKLKLGTIGTSSITDVFIEAAQQSGYFQLYSVYSRKLDKAKKFGEKYKEPKAYDHLDDFLQDSELDVVYIASPNSLHYEQTKVALEAGKHVLVEKPAFTLPERWDKIEALAKEKGKVVIEAVRHIQEPNFERLRKEVHQLEDIQGASFSFMSYSSRYEKVKEGEEPNIFSLKFAGGALMDLGVYTVYAAVDLFGEPESVNYFAKKIETGVDGYGVAILHYSDFDVTLFNGKTATTTLPAEVYSTETTLRFNHITLIDTIEKIDTTTLEVKEIPCAKPEENMLYDEAVAFGKILSDPNSAENQAKVEQLTDLAKAVSRTLYKCRMDAEIYFPEDR